MGIPLPPGIPLPAAPSAVRAPQRGVPRAPVHSGRPAMRNVARGEFVGRNGEVLTRNNRSNTQADQFDLPSQLKRPGWDYLWMRTSCHGKPDPANMNAHHENGWRAVPSSDLPGHYHPKEYTGAIERDGLMLMERPMAMSEQAKQDGIRAAQAQRQKQSAQFAAVADMLHDTGGQAAAFEASSGMTDHYGVARPMLKRSIEGVPGQLYPQRSLALGDED